MHELLQFILEPFLNITLLSIGYPIGYIIVSAMTLDTIEPGPLKRAGDLPYYRSKGMKWWHTTYLNDGKRYLPAETVAAIPWLLLLAVTAVVGAAIHFAAY